MKNHQQSKKHLIRTTDSIQEEKENLRLCAEIMGFKNEYQVTRHHLYRQVRMQHETVNDLVLELYAQNPNHILFNECPKEVKANMAKEISKRENRNNWGFGKTTRNKLTF